MSLPTKDLHELTSLDEQGGGQSDWAGALAQAEKVLRELALITRRSQPTRSRPANEAPKTPSLVPMDRLVLDLDFVVQKDRVIELTEVGYRRIAQAHSAAIDVVIAIDSRDVLRLPAWAR